MRPPELRDLPACTPPVSDERWARWTAPLVAFLARPRTWSQIADWATDHGLSQVMVKHLLAWLSFNRRADAEGATWRLRAAPPAAADASLLVA